MKLRVVSVAVLALLAVTAMVFYWKGGGKTTATVTRSSKSRPAALTSNDAPRESVDLHSAVEQSLIKAEFRGNGREKLRATLTNSGQVPLKVQADAGLTFESGQNAVIVARPKVVELSAGETAELLLQTCATRSTNRVSEMTYKVAYTKISKLEPLLAYAAEHPELSAAALQTAALALVENLPLSAVAKFTPAAGELKSRFNTDAFRVETIDLVAALSALRAMGIPEKSLALTVDPQLKIEAMIEPLSRVAAMQYYGISPESEWEYWKGELLYGEPTTRHYALYGIARFYPEIALEMLPNWARQSKTSQVYRISALQALADTQRAEALSILNQLAEDLGEETELGRAARGAAEFLKQRLSQLALKQNAVAFRATTVVP